MKHLDRFDIFKNSINEAYPYNLESHFSKEYEIVGKYRPFQFKNFVDDLKKYGLDGYQIGELDNLEDPVIFNRYARLEGGPNMFLLFKGTKKDYLLALISIDFKKLMLTVPYTGGWAINRTIDPKDFINLIFPGWVRVK